MEVYGQNIASVIITALTVFKNPLLSFLRRQVTKLQEANQTKNCHIKSTWFKGTLESFHGLKIRKLSANLKSRFNYNCDDVRISAVIS